MMTIENILFPTIRGTVFRVVKRIFHSLYQIQPEYGDIVKHTCSQLSYQRYNTINKSCGENLPFICTGFGLNMEMSRLTRDGTAEPALRDQTRRRERGQ